MKRLVPIALILIIISAIALYFFNQYWIHRYDALIERQAGIYRLDPDLVWSVVYEETYFRPWKHGADGEIGLMQVTPMVGREWAAETGMRDLERQMAKDPESVLRDPERNIQIGCWYLEKIYADYRDVPGAEARMIAGYNAGPSRAADWNRVAGGARPLTTEEFIARIDIPSTRAYVTSILERYRKLKEKSRRAEGAKKKAVNTSRTELMDFPSPLSASRLWPSAFHYGPCVGAGL
jgi:soluble lytic murein transglycosylase